MEQFTDGRPTDSQLYAVAKLVGYCESIAASGLVGELMERRLRERIAETLIAFGMDGHQDNVKTAMEQVR
jgi:hypothetical protein